MENLTLLDVNKPEKVKEALNELISYKNTATEIQEITAEGIGLGNVDNTHDLDKPLSVAQQTYIDNENQKNVKLQSETIQRIDSDLLIAKDKILHLERGDETSQEALKISEENGYEKLNVGSRNVPLRLQHCSKDKNGNILSKNPEIIITDENGSVIQEEIAFNSDIQKINEQKIDKEILEETEMVSSVEGQYFTDVSVDEMSLNITIRNVLSGAVVSETSLPLKLASNLSRGLMSKEDVATLNELLERVSAMEGKATRYIYIDSNSPTAEEIDRFVKDLGNTSPYSGIAVVVAGTYHVWHYYENDGIGWRDDGSDTVSQATNTSFGIVIGSNEKGKIYIESDGSMSLVGFDEITNKLIVLETVLDDLLSGDGNLIKSHYEVQLVEDGNSFDLTDSDGNPYSLDIEDGKNYLVSYTCNGVSGSQVVTAKAEVATEDGKYACWLGTFSSPIMLYDETGAGFFGAFGLCSKLKAIDFASNSFEYDENNTMVFTIAYPGMSGTVTITGVEPAKEYYLKEEVYNKTEVDELIANAGGGETGGDYSVVEELPQAELGKMVYYKEKGYKTYDLSSATETLVSIPSQFGLNHEMGTLTGEMVDNLEYAYSSSEFYLNLGAVDLSDTTGVIVYATINDVETYANLAKQGDNVFTAITINSSTLTGATVQLPSALGFAESTNGVYYLKCSIQNVASFSITQITKEDGTVIYEAPIVDKDFNADNIKVADGSEFKPLKEALGVPDQISYNNLTDKPISSVSYSNQILYIYL